jgi:hypothetical protein
MQLMTKLAAVAVAGCAASLMLAGGPAIASTTTAHPKWVSGREVVFGQLTGRAAWVQASKRVSSIPVRFHGVLRTRGVVGLGSSKSKNHSIWTPVGTLSARVTSSRDTSTVNRARCRVQVVEADHIYVRGRHSTGVFAGAKGNGRVRVLFAFNFPRKHNGKCNFRGQPRKRGGIIKFRAVFPWLWVR